MSKKIEYFCTGCGKYFDEISDSYVCPSCASTVRCPIISPFTVFDVVVMLLSSKTPVNDKPNPPEVTASAATSAVIVVVVFIRSLTT